ncbi:Uncharacterised protein [Yersinia pseudotuberculosis]|nr:Uncharacterised protein [Yersinia pseudotuberculosis]SUP84471.1 Uncharacterised protein [Yersinia pseudotuberculosis]
MSFYENRAVLVTFCNFLCDLEASKFDAATDLAYKGYRIELRGF